MVSLKLDELKEGMVLARDVKDRNGRVLLSSGQKIAEKHLKIFKAWGVTDVAVEGLREKKREEVVLSGNVDPQEVEKIKREMSALFRHADIRHPAIRELFNLCVARKLKPQSGLGATDEI